MLSILSHALLHALQETLLLLPLLFLTYLLMELLEHKASEKTQRIVAGVGKAGPALGGALGAVPMCGFSGAIAGLFAAGVVSFGTLIAVILSVIRRRIERIRMIGLMILAA